MQNINKNNLLLQIKKTENLNYELITNDCELDENKNVKSLNNCWFLFKKSKIKENSLKYKVNQGEIIRFGRITVRIKEINDNKGLNLSKSIEKNQSNNNINDNENSFLKENQTKINDINKNPLTFSTDINKINVLTISNNNKGGKIEVPNNLVQSTLKISNIKLPKICRICYGEEDPNEDTTNPLVQPCKCSGSLKYIHLNCLKQWLSTKSCLKVEKNVNYSLFLIKRVECELCREKFPDFVKHNDKLYEILDFKSEFKNYLTIECLTLDKNNNRCLYVVNLENNHKLKIGRGHDANIVLSDISVSRVHSILTIENQKVFLEDNNSKFGTLILVQSPTLKLIENLPLYIQIGRTFLECLITKSSLSSFCCCDASEKPNSNYYFLQNEKKKQINLQKMFTIKSEIFSDNKEIEEEKLEEIEDQKQINNRYEDNYHDLNNTRLKGSNEENEISINIRANRRLLVKDINDIKINENNENIQKDNKNIIKIVENNEMQSNNLINKSESIILESEDEEIKE